MSYLGTLAIAKLGQVLRVTHAMCGQRIHLPGETRTPGEGHILNLPIVVVLVVVVVLATWSCNLVLQLSLYLFCTCYCTVLCAGSCSGRCPTQWDAENVPCSYQLAYAIRCSVGGKFMTVCGSF